MKYLIFFFISFQVHSIDLNDKVPGVTKQGDLIRVNSGNDEAERLLNLPHNAGSHMTYRSYEVQQKDHNRIAKEYIITYKAILVLDEMPDLSSQCELRSQGYHKEKGKCVNLETLNGGKRCSDGSYVSKRSSCPKPNTSGYYINNQGCDKEKILNATTACKLPDGFEFKENGAIGRIGDGYLPAIHNNKGCEPSAAANCEEVHDTYAMCNGEKYTRHLGQDNSLLRKAKPTSRSGSDSVIIRGAQRLNKLE